MPRATTSAPGDSGAGPLRPIDAGHVRVARITALPESGVTLVTHPKPSLRYHVRQTMRHSASACTCLRLRGGTVSAALARR